MTYKITEIMPKWINYKVKILIPTGAKTIEFRNGIAKTTEECVAEHFRKNPLRYQVEPEET